MISYNFVICYILGSQYRLKPNHEWPGYEKTLKRYHQAAKNRPEGFVEERMIKEQAGSVNEGLKEPREWRAMRPFQGTPFGSVGIKLIGIEDD